MLFAEDLSLEQLEMWGASNAGSSAITGEAAKLLGLTGHRGGGHAAAEIAVALLNSIARAKPSRVALYSGRTMAAPRVGETLRLSTTALTDNRSFALTFAEGASPILLRFLPGIRAFRYSDVEWITAGDFRVVSSRVSKDPFWGTPLRLVTLAVL